MIKALVFDFDGIIADSEPVHLRAFQKTVSRLGLSLPSSEYYSLYLACDDRAFFTMFLEKNGIPAPREEIERLTSEKGSFFEQMAAERVRIFPGVAEFLESVHGRFTICIGSGALSAEIKTVLERSGLSRFFDFIVGADHTENPKPSPEVYLKCLEGIQSSGAGAVAPEQCVVFEDSPGGVLAAKRAGMKCVGITNTCYDDALELADVVCGGFSEITEQMLADL